MPTVAERRASLEIIGKMPMLFVGRLPLLPVKTKNGILADTANKLSKKAFYLSAYRMIAMIEFDKKERAEKYKITDEQVASIISEIPRFELLRDDLMKRVKEARENYGLEA